MSKEGRAEERRAEALYVAGTCRVDCCGRCRHSRIEWKKLYCFQLRATVQTMGVCAKWTPMRRTVTA